jgi:hypothetical protein
LLAFKKQPIGPNQLNDKANQMALLNYIASREGIQSPEDWYKVTKAKFESYGKLWYQTILTKVGGDKLLSLYGGTMLSLLSAFYPTIQWKPYLFVNPVIPQQFWNSKANQREFFDYVGKLLGVEKLEDWIKVSKEQIEKLGGREMLRRYRNSLLHSTLQLDIGEIILEIAMPTL